MNIQQVLKDAYDDSCSICCQLLTAEETLSIHWGQSQKNNIKQGERIAHVFHEACLKKWRNIKNICPMCSCEISVNDYHVILSETQRQAFEREWEYIETPWRDERLSKEVEQLKADWNGRIEVREAMNEKELQFLAIHRDRNSSAYVLNERADFKFVHNDLWLNTYHPDKKEKLVNYWELRRCIRIAIGEQYSRLIAIQRVFSHIEYAHTAIRILGNQIGISLLFQPLIAPFLSQMNNRKLAKEQEVRTQLSNYEKQEKLLDTIVSEQIRLLRNLR